MDRAVMMMIKMTMINRLVVYILKSGNKCGLVTIIIMVMMLLHIWS